MASVYTYMYNSEVHIHVHVRTYMHIIIVHTDRAHFAQLSPFDGEVLLEQLVYDICNSSKQQWNNYSEL